jgi:hypothetical protein
MGSNTKYDCMWLKILMYGYEPVQCLEKEILSEEKCTKFWIIYGSAKFIFLGGENITL